MADHLQLRARAWRLALDPQTRTWLAETKRSVADGSAKQAAASEEDVQRMIEERRRRLP
jgi:CRISPR/Cas system-associated protein Csm6